MVNKLIMKMNNTVAANCSDSTLQSDEFIEQLYNWVTIFSIYSILGGLSVVVYSLLRIIRVKKAGEAIYTHIKSCKKKQKVLEKSTERDSQTVCTQLKNPGSHLLLYISFADIIVSASHLWGVSLSKQNKLYLDPEENYPWQFECGAQAVLSIFGTIASFLWTFSLAFLTIVHIFNKAGFRKVMRSNFWFSLYQVFLWGVPLCTAIGFGVTGKLGYDRFGI